MKNIFIALKCSLGFFGVIVILFLSLGNYKTAEQMKKNREVKDFRYFLKITDQYDTNSGMSLHNFFSEADSLNKLRDAYSLLLAYFGSQYLEIGEQSIEYIGICDLDEKFVVGGNEAKNQEIKEINEIITPLYSVQLGKSTIKNIKLNKMIESGREFTEEDFVLNEKNMVIPIILGNTYKNQFKINDTFSFFYLGKQFSGKIIAFLAQDSSIAIDDIETKNLDNMIVIPSFEIDTNYNDADFNKTLSLLKTEGYVVYESQKEYQNILDKIDLIKKNTGIQYSYVENLNIIPLNQCYFMPKYLALFLVVLGEILFCLYMMFMLKIVQRVISVSKIINILLALLIITVGVYELSYLSLINIQNKALLLNIMRVKYTVIAELLISFIVFVIIICRNVFKNICSGGIVNESNRCN